MDVEAVTFPIPLVERMAFFTPVTAKLVVVALVVVAVQEVSPPANVVEAFDQILPVVRLRSTFTFPVGEETVSVFPELAMLETQCELSSKVPVSPIQVFPPVERSTKLFAYIVAVVVPFPEIVRPPVAVPFPIVEEAVRIRPFDVVDVK